MGLLMWTWMWSTAASRDGGRAQRGSWQWQAIRRRDVQRGSGPWSGFSGEGRDFILLFLLLGVDCKFWSTM
ncbi:Os05g0419301 [Oryza sativa Japonica Group]|uniref:Os05g0419301 protein n=1 Tax=Oryza sativa subsp. japonica TaxID=39947 RepID=A0A0P0WMH5_ORYSJ|nr:hypothetical protein EE612_029553 [Oryza sativa]KAF2930821.1 hypothetical protein DAI22_05g164400 [Oryza sativa Japonica Group]BAS94064.1 Os05g0419301 [Oryza sativa Japonica Group]